MADPSPIVNPFLSTVRLIQDGIDTSIRLCDSILENQNVGKHPTQLQALRDSLSEGHKAIRIESIAISNLPGADADGGDATARGALARYIGRIDLLNSRLRDVTALKDTHHDHHHHHTYYFFSPPEKPKQVKVGFHSMREDWEQTRDEIISVFEELRVRLLSNAAAKVKKEKDEKEKKDKEKLDALARANKEKLETTEKAEEEKLKETLAAEKAARKKEAKRLKRMQEEEERRLKALNDMEESFMKRKLEEKPMEQLKGVVDVMGTIEDNMVIKEIKELKPPNYPPEHHHRQQQLQAPLPPNIIMPWTGGANSGPAPSVPRHAVGHITLPNGSVVPISLDFQ